jgi:uncharacterized protein YukE
MDDIVAQIRRWEAKAEELRTTADHLLSPLAQAWFRRAANTYDDWALQFSKRLAAKSIERPSSSPPL